MTDKVDWVRISGSVMIQKGTNDMSNDIVKKQLVYWIQVDLDGTIIVQNGPGLLTVDYNPASPQNGYKITMPPNYSVPMNRRGLVLTPTPPTIEGRTVLYFKDSSTDNTVVVRGTSIDTPGDPCSCGFILEISRIEAAIGVGTG